MPSFDNFGDERIIDSYICASLGRELKKIGYSLLERAPTKFAQLDTDMANSGPRLGLKEMLLLEDADKKLWGIEISYFLTPSPELFSPGERTRIRYNKGDKPTAEEIIKVKTDVVCAYESIFGFLKEMGDYVSSSGLPNHAQGSVMKKILESCKEYDLQEEPRAGGKQTHETIMA